jgi:hypothetical protein
MFVEKTEYASSKTQADHASHLPFGLQTASSMSQGDEFK